MAEIAPAGEKVAEVHDKQPETSINEQKNEQNEKPSDEDLLTLRRVAGTLPWALFTVAFVELCERFSYYGTTAVFVNFIQRPLPDGSSTGAGGDTSVPGALGMGQRASTGLTLFNSFWSYLMPLFGAFLADQYTGRFKTIMWAILVAMVGHMVLVISAIPAVISNPSGSIACFAVGLVIMGIGTGGFKANISPLIAEQYQHSAYKKILPSGERVIVDPEATVARIYLYFYLMINVGSLLGQISMVYAERYVGFWLAFLLPTAMFCLCPTVLWFCQGKYVLVPPGGSVYAQAFRVWRFALKQWKFKQQEDFWDKAKPSTQTSRPSWMTFDDEWVDEVRRGFKACKVFLWFPLWYLAYNQMINNLTSQAATLHLGGVPNDIINNLNPLSLIIFIPIMDNLVYPFLRKIGIQFSPLKRITAGFFVSCASMVAAAIIQLYIYRLGPCGYDANTCANEGKQAPITVWVQAVPYILGGISEIFASITSLEYAFTQAPTNMRSLVQALALFMNAFSAAIGQAFTGLAEDPLLVWNYAVVAILAALGGVGFWGANWRVDREECRGRA